MPDITLLDGGMGKALDEAGAPFRQPEWSALALMEAPEWVERVHQQFVDAGADVVITNNYAVVPFHLGDRCDALLEELTDLSGRIARTVADRADRSIVVAGSIPPLFGSYEPEKFDPVAAPALLERIAGTLAPHVDVFVAETQSSIAEATASFGAAARHGKPVWVAATLEDGGGPAGVAAHVEISTLRSGEPVEDFVEAMDDLGASAVLFNCSQPEVMRHAIGVARSVLGDSIDVGAYANAFEDKPSGYAANEVLATHRHDIEDGGYSRFAEAWVEAGATIVGGCCGIMPRHIEHLRATLDR
ncbi:MAG: homocysteine S-methyltransferase family protein [Actinomycetota bacterium]